jgi:Tol biopolymer transport system component
VALAGFATMSPDVSADGLTIVYGINGGSMEIGTFSGSSVEDLQTGGDSPRFSPDGTKLAYEAGDAIHVMLLADLSTTEVIDAGTYLGSVDWFSDGNRLAVTTDAGIEIVDVSVSPATRTLIRDDFAATDVDISADDSRIAYVVNGTSDVYVLTDF